MANSVRLSTQRQFELMQQLQELADARAQSESEVAASLQAELAAADEAYRARIEKLDRQAAELQRQLENQFKQAQSSASVQGRQAKQAAEEKYAAVRERLEKAVAEQAAVIKKQKKETQWQSLAVFDAAKGQPRQMLEAATQRIQARRAQVDSLQRDAQTLLAMRGQASAAKLLAEQVDDSAGNFPAEVDSQPEAGRSTEQAAEESQQRNLKQLHQEVLSLQDQRLPRLLLAKYRFFGWWLVACLVAAAATAWPVGWTNWLWPVVAVGLGTLLTGAVYGVWGQRARRQSLDQFAKILGLVRQAWQLEGDAQAAAEAFSQQAAAKIDQRKQQEMEAAEQLCEQKLSQNAAQLQEKLQQAVAARDAAVEQAAAGAQQALAEAERRFPPRLEQLARQREEKAQSYLEQKESRQAAAHRAHDADWQALAERWQTGFRVIMEELSAMEAACGQLFPDWTRQEWGAWRRPTEPPQAIQFGSYRLPLRAVKNGISADERLIPAEQEITLPALMTLDELPGMSIVGASQEGRSAAVEMLQAVMLRFLTTIPAGKLRFTIIDPAALGENFAGFMHLADYDEQLVGRQIWTDAREIDERLTLLSDHMEKVLQKYLRNEFDSIHEYNAQAGEVAEPYQVVVVANLPVGLSDAALQKLMTIAKTGPRCGVYVLLSIDASRRLPDDAGFADLMQNSVQLEWASDKLRWNYPFFEKLPLAVDRLPPRQRLNDLLAAAGQESHVASRVEVPFSVVAPPQDQMWAGSTARELVVPVGRAGANNLQEMRLGRGTSQHVLISGKTGSGKSTLLHALITNLALYYSPDEVEFYLIDFKKGVEFKAYATGELPHARVIAIESEREFGLSVLERLDGVLRERGVLFRDLGVQDLAGARAVHTEPLPRVLLIVDEFQELFVADDKLSQDAALLMDRLVRQGRAFGMHVLLGSQTLAGAYSLARSTLGQMAIRIALECSEADAHLILSDENSAARLLNRPGEAIYNDQNGLTAGNSPFQVVWLTDEQRQVHLAEVQARQRAEQRASEPAIVFEGNLPACPQDNPELMGALENPAVTAEPTLWLGSAVRIEPPTQLTLRRQGGNHVLILGPAEPLALGILATSLVAMVAQFPGQEARFTIVDGTRPESSERGAWPEMVAALPSQVEVHELAETATVIEDLAAEVTRRTESEAESYPPHFLLLYDLAQIRALRLTEDDFGFSSFSGGDAGDKPVALDKRLRSILREGPAVGIHVLMWCDSYNSLTRYFDRLTMREIDYRVALPMSSGDSTSFIDSPAAGRLGEQRAIFYRDDLGTQVKFRPYGRPTEEWLTWVGERLAGTNPARS